MRRGEGGNASVLSVTFELDGQEFIWLNGGPIYQFTPAVSWSGATTRIRLIIVGTGARQAAHRNDADD